MKQKKWVEQFKNDLHCFGVFLKRQNFDNFPCSKGEKGNVVFPWRL